MTGAGSSVTDIDGSRGSPDPGLDGRVGQGQRLERYADSLIILQGGSRPVDPLRRKKEGKMIENWRHADELQGEADNTNEIHTSATFSSKWRCFTIVKAR